MVEAAFLGPSGCGVICLPGKMPHGPSGGAKFGMNENPIQKNSEVGLARCKCAAN